MFAIVGGLLVVLVAGIGAWAALGPGSYGRSADGCVTVVEPSSTGGAVLHACGSDAQALCRRAPRLGTGRGHRDISFATEQSRA